MSTSYIIQTVVEIVIAIALIVGFIYEPIVAKWEKKQGERILRAFNKRRYKIKNEKHL